MSENLKKIEDLGCDDFFEEGRKKLGLESFQIARIIAEHKGSYKVKNIRGEFLAKITGKQIFRSSSQEDYPAVGDWVSISELDEGKAIINVILPRKTLIKRKRGGNKDVQVIAANIDVVFVVESVGRDFSLSRFERYFAIAGSGKIKPVIILNKIDLISREELDEKMHEIRKRFGNIDVILTSTIAYKGLDDLKEYIKRGKTHCFLGSSGVGKSSLINCLLGGEKIKTREIGRHSGRGKHTTTSREMHFLENGGIVIDNPGMREIGMADSQVGIENFFDEISSIAEKCKFKDCKHICEPGCAVLDALNSGEIDKEKYSNYIKLRKESEFFDMNEVEKREKERRFGKFMKKAKKELKNFRHKDYLT